MPLLRFLYAMIFIASLSLALFAFRTENQSVTCSQDVVRAIQAGNMEDWRTVSKDCASFAASVAIVEHVTKPTVPAPDKNP